MMCFCTLSDLREWVLQIGQPFLCLIKTGPGYSTTSSTACHHATVINIDGEHFEIVIRLLTILLA